MRNNIFADKFCYIWSCKDRNDIKKIKEVFVELLDKVKSAIASINHCFDKEEGQAKVMLLYETSFIKIYQTVFLITLRFAKERCMTMLLR
ncbi:hypothetical protein NXV69_13235 [Bacteroides ovatus]|uniref:hypothetical protein n=1 Tax=Bacteroides ovatus TaxID=28116 RepID=UPI002165526D|nr:hypothetical protein [Bacteroides ovatus]MCS2930549.1 hypothetical protein [Bacteroides ovatus]